MYQCAELPDDPRVPAHLRGAVVWFRHDNDGPEHDPDLNRAEVLRTVCESDRGEWCDLYYDRPGSESDNARDQNNLPNRRAPSLGARSQQIDLLRHFASRILVPECQHMGRQTHHRFLRWMIFSP